MSSEQEIADIVIYDSRDGMIYFPSMPAQFFQPSNSDEKVWLCCSKKAIIHGFNKTQYFTSIIMLENNKDKVISYINSFAQKTDLQQYKESILDCLTDMKCYSMEDLANMKQSSCREFQFLSKIIDSTMFLVLYFFSDDGKKIWPTYATNTLGGTVYYKDEFLSSSSLLHNQEEDSSK